MVPRRPFGAADPSASTRCRPTPWERCAARCATSERYAGLDERRGITLLPLRDVRIHPMVDGAIIPAASLLMSIVGLVLALVCSNLAILLLLRGSAQRREVSIRAAIGAGRGRIVRRFLTESVLLSIAGGVVGCLLAGWLLRSLSVPNVALIPGTLDLTLNYRVLAFAVPATEP